MQPLSNHINTCLVTYDNRPYMYLEFLSTVSYSIGAHSDALCELEIETNRVGSKSWSRRVTSGPSLAAASSRSQMSKQTTLKSAFVCIRDPQLAFVQCSQQRFCLSFIAYWRSRVSRSGVSHMPHPWSLTNTVLRLGCLNYCRIIEWPFWGILNVNNCIQVVSLFLMAHFTAMWFCDIFGFP